MAPMFDFAPCSPEDRGIPGRAVEDFERKLAERRVRMHGYLMLSGGRLIAERYWPPFDKDSLHRMYSVTKSFTALAVGLLVRDGLVSVDDLICDYFPDKLPAGGPHPWCGEMTVGDMLTMRTCHSSTTYKRYGGDWVKSFFRVEPDHVPGTVFAYDTSAPHVLAALTERLTGMPMLDYLRREALEAVGFGSGAYILRDPSGVSQGGTGLMCTLRDVAGAAFLCLRGGEIDGRRILPAGYMGRAVSDLVPTDLQPPADERNGYGYFFWQARRPGYVMYGMGGQLALCVPEADMCLVTMADTLGDPAGVQSIYDSFYDTVWPWLGVPDRETEQASGGDVPSGRYIFYPNGMGWQWIDIDPDRREVTVRLPEMTARFGPEYGVFPGTDYPCMCETAAGPGHLIMKVFVTGEEQGHLGLDLAARGGRLGVRAVNTGEPFFSGLRGFASAVRE